MNHFYHKLLIVITALLSFTRAANAESVWELVANVSEIHVGDTVIIVARDAEYAMSTEQKANNRGQIAIKKVDMFCSVETVSNSTYGIQKFILREGKKDNTYAFSTGDGYLYAASSGDNNWLRTETTLSNNSSWKITITEEETKIIAQGTNTNNELRYNNKSALFSCYHKSSTQPEVVLYKLTDPNSIKDCTITLSVDGIEENETLRAGSRFTLPSEVTKVAGLDFVGWSTTPFPLGTTEISELNSPGETVTIDDTITYYAVYAKKEEVKEPTYTKIESEPNDWIGTYLIVCESEGIAFDGSLAEIDIASNYKSVTISNNKIESNAETDAIAFHINAMTNGYSVQSESKIYIGNTEEKNQIQTSAKAILNTISYNGDNGVYIKGTDAAKYYAIRYYKNDRRLRYYPYSNNLPIQLYKLNQTSSAYTYYTTSLNIEVTANKYGYTTWYSTVPVSIPEGLNAYYCTIEDKATAILHPINGTIPSSTAAILFSSEAATTQWPKSYTLSYTDTTTQNVSGNHLIGYTEDTEVNNGVSHYALNVLNGIVGFYVPKTAIGDNPTPESPFTAKAGKAYLSINPNEAPASYAIRRIDKTDINPTKETMPQCEMQIYDLFGRPVKHANKGIYITNGKKVFF